MADKLTPFMQNLKNSDTAEVAKAKSQVVAAAVAQAQMQLDRSNIRKESDPRNYNLILNNAATNAAAKFDQDYERLKKGNINQTPKGTTSNVSSNKTVGRNESSRTSNTRNRSNGVTNRNTNKKGVSGKGRSKDTKTTAGTTNKDAVTIDNSKRKNIENFWVRDGKGKQTTIDVYKEVKGVGTVNSGTDKDGKGFANTFDIKLAKSISNFTKKGGLLDKIKSGAKIYKKARDTLKGGGNIWEKIGGLTGLTKDVLGTMNIAEGSDLYKNIMKGSEYIIKGAKTAHRVKDVDWHDVQSISKLINEYTGKNDLINWKDYGAEAKFVANLLNQATANGFPSNFKELAAKVSNTGVMKSVLGDILPVTVAMADMGGLKDIIDFAKGEDMRSLFPGLLDNASKRYTRNWFRDKKDTARWYDIDNAYSAYNPDWWKISRGDANIISIQSMVNGSKDFKEVAKTGLSNLDGSELDKKFLILGTIYKNTTVESKLKQHFPRVLWKNNTVNLATMDKALLPFQSN